MLTPALPIVLALYVRIQTTRTCEMDRMNGCGMGEKPAFFLPCIYANKKAKIRKEKKQDLGIILID